MKRSGSSKDTVSRKSSLSGGSKDKGIHEAMEGEGEVEEDEDDSVAALKARLRSMGVLGEPAIASDKPLPVSPPIQRKVDPRAAVNSDDGVYRARRARHKEMYLEQEEQLRIKAAHCKEIVRCVSFLPSSLESNPTQCFIYFVFSIYIPLNVYFPYLDLILIVHYTTGSSTELRKQQPRPLKILLS